MNPVLLWFHQLGSPPIFDRFAARWAPWCHAVAPDAKDGLHITLKSGNFGSTDFFTKAFAQLQA